jgi:hypothetical protein
VRRIRRINPEASILTTTQLRQVRDDHASRHGAIQPGNDGTAPGNMTGDYSANEIEFQNTVDAYKRVNNRPFPKWSEILAVLLAMGYWRDKIDDGPASPATTTPTREERARARGVKIGRRPPTAARLALAA